MDSPYNYRHTFKTELVDHEDEETGETYKKDVLSPVQLIRFTTDAGIPYLWYAKQSRYDGTVWNIAFGVDKGMDDREYHQLDIGMTGTGNAARIFATVIDIINSFIQWDDDYNEVQRLIFTSKGAKRTKFYLNQIVPRIENFKIENSRDIGGDETEIMMVRTS